jgi:valyl-tRNA synthetase
MPYSVKIASFTKTRDFVQYKSRLIPGFFYNGYETNTGIKMTQELPKIYDPQSTQQQAEQLWQKGRYFHADADKVGPKGAYAIVIPPPNVTAALHLGHALNNTLQDILVRFHRMQGYAAMWMPGTDHAGIATQTVVDKRLRAERKLALVDYKEMEKNGQNGRSQFIAKVQSWKDEYEARILEQLKSMGCSCDWDRTRFTMDEVCAKAVRAVFFKLFADGLIYRGKRLVNWDPATQTVLADDEVEHQTIKGFFWYLKYPLVEPVVIDGQKIEYVTVATTRPETMLGDTAVAMNLADPRAKMLVGKMVRLPIVGRPIPIIADEHVVLPDPESSDEKAKFSTGFLKVTPAHDPDDWQIGQRHNLPVINIMAPDGSISEKFGWTDWDAIKNPEVENLIGMDRFEAREAVVEWFREENLLAEIRDYSHEVGHSYRSHVPIEPYLSDQWYIAVKKPIPNCRLSIDDCRLETETRDGVAYIKGTDVPVNSLAGLALWPLLDGRLKFYPERYSKNYQTWLENLRDWPISRQLWWGHRIPIWYAELDVNVFKSSTLGAVHASPDEFQNQFRELLNNLSKAAGLGNSLACQYNPDNPAEVYICPLSENADILISEFKNFAKSQELKEVVPGKDIEPSMDSLPSFPNATKQAFELLFKFDIRGRDEDVLDTWFSSALWPFSTMGWPEDVPELKKFYPTNVLCTAREIITLWVSRMVMMGQYCLGDIPFGDVYIHAMIQDGQGRKMSKSLGNGIDPLTIIESHGADAMRFTLASMTTDTQDVRMPVAALTLPDGRKVNSSPKFDNGRNFCNKLWNASRFAMMNLEGTDPAAFDSAKMDITDKWILSRLSGVVKEATASLKNYKFNDPVNALYKFFWNDLCDWYLEWAKPRMADAIQKPIAQNVLAFVLDQTLRMLHPFIPFITEGIFQNLNAIAPVRKLGMLADAAGAESIMVAAWPAGLEQFINPEVERKIETIQNIIGAIRDIRNKYNIHPAKRLVGAVDAPAQRVDMLNENIGLICDLAGMEKLTVAAGQEKPANTAAAIVEDLQVYVYDVVDVEAERQRLQKQKEFIENGIRPLQAKLSNESFVSRAKPEVVEQSRQKLKELTDQLDAVNKHLSELG